MLPWLAFSEPAGRAPHVILEHRNFVKKLIFPLETLPVNQVVAGLVTQVFATTVFIAEVLLIRERFQPL
jgi:lipopolysaccharide transport system permease protein